MVSAAAARHGQTLARRQCPKRGRRSIGFQALAHQDKGSKEIAARFSLFTVARTNDLSTLSGYSLLLGTPQNADALRVVSAKKRSSLTMLEIGEVRLGCGGARLRPSCRNDRELPPLPAVERGQRDFAAVHCVLLEEEPHARGNALVADIAYPVELHWPHAAPRVALGAGDRPVEGGHVDRAEILQQRLE